MRRRGAAAVLVAALAAGPLPVAGATASDPAPRLEGRWRNTSGSELELSLDGRRVAGRFRNAAGTARSAAGYPVTGWRNGDLLAFCVDWGAPLDGEPSGAVPSVACFVGQHTVDDEGPLLRTQWHVSRNVADRDEAEDLWGSVLTGADEFRPAPPVSGPGGP